MSFIAQSIKKIFSYWLMILNTILLSGMIYAAIHLIKIGNEAKVLKGEYTQLHSVQYGLFNSSIWADKISLIVGQKIDEFNFTQSSRAEIKTYVETILDTLIVEADRSIRTQNNKKRGFFDSLLGDTKQMVTDSLIDIKKLRDRVPEFTDTIINELERPANQELLKTVMRDKLHQLTANNLARTDISGYNKILARYNCTDLETCNKILQKHLHDKAEEMSLYTVAILIMSAALILFVLLQGTVLKSISLFLLTVTSITLLIPGILLPMLDIEAKISKLYFSILDKPLIFTDQILFFQSKSISDLVRLLLESNENKMIFVGVLLTTFSVIFPTLKLISTYLYFYSRSFIGNNAAVRFFALRSTKWSMADVMVVSIFMAYLGLDGVIDNELKILEAQSDPINVITTNGTQLQVGFFLFLGFVFSSFVLSVLVGKSRENTYA